MTNEEHEEDDDGGNGQRQTKEQKDLGVIWRKKADTKRPEVTIDTSDLRLRMCSSQLYGAVGEERRIIVGGERGGVDKTGSEVQ
jgi:hypothetical protein